MSSAGFTYPWSQKQPILSKSTGLLQLGKAAGPRHTRSMGNAALQVLPRRQQLAYSDVSHVTFPLVTPVCTPQSGGSSSAFRKVLGMSTDLRLALYTSQCIQPNSAHAFCNWVLGGIVNHDRNRCNPTGTASTKPSNFTMSGLASTSIASSKS